jgi:CRISPR-associated protein Cas6/Cse3/CasE subtype I-E
VKLVRRGQPVIRESARFEGMLQVTDASRIEVALERGIGRSHAFGFGLLRLFYAK